MLVAWDHLGTSCAHRQMHSNLRRNRSWQNTPSPPDWLSHARGLLGRGPVLFPRQSSCVERYVGACAIPAQSVQFSVPSPLHVPEMLRGGVETALLPGLAV